MVITKQEKYKTTGVIWSSLKPSEKRMPIYHEHLSVIPKELMKNMVYEIGYASDYGITSEYLIKLGARVDTRENCLKLPQVLITKPMPDDLKQMKDSSTLCGWIHTVQQKEIAQIAIDKKLSLLAWENMVDNGIYVWNRNRELAGFSSVLLSLQLLGIDGFYGPRRNVAIFGYGMTARGAIHALLGRGFENIHVYTQRPTHLVANRHPNCYYHNYNRNVIGNLVANKFGVSETDLIEELSQYDIIVNAILQDVNNPVMFINNSDELHKLKKNAIIIDISIDEEMGFYFAKPTSMKDPMFIVPGSDNIRYVGVDNSPTYLFDAATREISLGLLPCLNDIMLWQTKNLVIIKAFDVVGGIIRNKNIITFQKREEDYPYRYLKT